MNNRRNLKLLFIVSTATLALAVLSPDCMTRAQVGFNKPDSRELSLVKATLPIYPRLAKVAGIQAVLDIEMVVNKAGRVIDVRRTRTTRAVGDPLRANILWEYVKKLVQTQWLFEVRGARESNLVRAQFVFELLPPQPYGSCVEPEIEVQLSPFIRVALTDYQIRAQ